jgi:hypothetical protein
VISQPQENFLRLGRVYTVTLRKKAGQLRKMAGFRATGVLRDFGVLTQFCEAIGE